MSIPPRRTTVKEKNNKTKEGAAREKTRNIAFLRHTDAASRNVLCSTEIHKQGAKMKKIENYTEREENYILKGRKTRRSLRRVIQR